MTPTLAVLTGAAAVPQAQTKMQRGRGTVAMPQRRRELMVAMLGRSRLPLAQPASASAATAASVPAARAGRACRDRMLFCCTITAGRSYGLT
jgi:hypothetical protein